MHLFWTTPYGAENDAPAVQADTAFTCYLPLLTSCYRTHGLVVCGFLRAGTVCAAFLLVESLLRLQSETAICFTGEPRLGAETAELVVVSVRGTRSPVGAVAYLDRIHRHPRATPALFFKAANCAEPFLMSWTPTQTVRELIALAKKQPGLFNVAINTPGSTSHLAAEMLKQKAGLDVTFVPFKGGGPAVASVISGETDFLFATGPAAAPHVRSGRVRALAVTTAKRSSAFPDLPTMNTIYPGFESDNWYAMFVRKGTPPEIVQKLNAEIRNALQSPRVKDFMAREGLDPVGSSPDELTAQVKREMAKYGEVIRIGAIRLQ